MVSLKSSIPQHQTGFKQVVTLAKDWEFRCLCISGAWRILPPDAQAWWLEFEDDHWVLFVGGVAQIRLQEREAIAFLRRRAQ